MEYLLQTDQNQSINIFLVKIVPLEIICFVASNHTINIFHALQRTIHLNHYFSPMTLHTSIGICDPNQVDVVALKGI